MSWKLPQAKKKEGTIREEIKHLTSIKSSRILVKYNRKPSFPILSQCRRKEGLCEDDLSVFLFSVSYQH